MKTPSVPALERAVEILEVLAHSRNGLTLSELRRQVDIPKSSTHCILVTLERLGYLHRNHQKGRYMFGLKLFSLAHGSLARIELRERIAPFLRDLMTTTGLTVHMAVLDKSEAVLVEKVEAPGPFRLATWVGKRMDLHCTGVGKALMAFLPEVQLQAILSQRLPRHNENTIVSLRKLKEELAVIKRCGYSFDNEEDEIGLVCIGAPLFDETGAVVAAISVAGTVDRLGRESLSSLAQKVKRTASSISQQLGYSPARAANIAAAGS